MKNLFWIDLEMTGLDEKTDKILEIAMVITDLNLEIIKEYQSVIFQPPEILKKMNEWCQNTHRVSGLLDAVPQGIPLEKAEEEILECMKAYFSPNERIVLTGNSVGNDKRFLDEYLPNLAKRLHYRLIDVSSFKEIFRDKYGVVFKKANTHRAIQDVYESIRELQLYLSFISLKHVSQAACLPPPIPPESTRPSFPNIYLQLAYTLSKRSTCQRLQVGTVITSTDFRKVLAVGYNGNATGLHNGCDRPDAGNCGCLHSEENAVIQCDSPRFVEKLVFVTHLPCVACAKRLINLGQVKTIYYSEPYRETHALPLLEEAGIPVIFMPQHLCSGEA